MTSRYRFFGRLSFLFALVILAGCSGKSEPLPDETPLGCAEDLDQDGYGLGCPRGNDCNDTNPTIHEGCDTCSTPNEGCECEPGSAPVACVDMSLADQDTVLCKSGTRYCRDGAWSACESVAQFEVEVDRKASRVGGTSLALGSEAGVDGGSAKDAGPLSDAGPASDAGVVSDAGAPVTDCTLASPPCCSICNPQCFNQEDPFTDGLPSGSGVVYADGGGITLDSTLDGGPIAISPTTDCIEGNDPEDVDCDGIPDDYELVTNRDDRPFGTTATAIFMTLGPGETGTAEINLDFFLRTVDIYFLFDMTAGTVSNNGTPADTSDDFNVVQRMIASLTSNPKVPNQPFYTGVTTCADTDQDGVPNNTAGQGMLGDLSCLLRNVRIGVGWTREVPFEGPVAGISYGDDRIHPSAAGTPDFSEFLFEQTSFLSRDMAAVGTSLGKLSLKENFEGPNGQMQGLWLTATGDEIYVGHDRPALPDQWRCATGFGYPCFESTAVPIVVMFTGAGMYNGPDTDINGGAIGNLGTSDDGFPYEVNYPLDLHKGKVHQGSYAGYIEVDNTNDTFDNPAETQVMTNPGTGATIEDMGDDLLTFTGDTTGMGKDVDASLLSCNGTIEAKGADAIYYFQLAQDEANFRISSEGTRFDTVLGIIKSDNGVIPDYENIDLTTFTGVSGDTAGTAYDLDTLPSGINATLQGQLSQTGNFPAEVLECYSAANTGQCGQTNKASDYAKDVVFKFNLEKDMKLWFQSVKDTWGSSMALFDAMPQGVTDINVMDGANPKETIYLPGGSTSTDPGALNGKAYRLVGNTGADGCNAFNINGLNEDYLNSAVLYTSAPDTDPTTSALDSHCNANGFKNASSDMEVRFKITQDDTNVVFETSGDAPKLDSNDNVLLALRKINTPDPNLHPATEHNNTNESWSSAFNIPQADFTPVGSVTEFAQVVGSMNDKLYDSNGDGIADTAGTQMAANIVPGELLTKVTSLTGVSSECSLPSGGINSLQDSVFKFTTTSTRSLKISALGVDGVKHYLSVHRASKFQTDPAFSTPTYTTSTRDETVTTTYNHTAVGTADSGFSLGNISGKTFSITNNTNKSSSNGWDDAFIPCNPSGTASKVQYYYFTVDQVDSAITVTLTPNSWASAVAVMDWNGTNITCANGTDFAPRTLTFTPSAIGYYVMIGGNNNAAAGAYSLSISESTAHDTLAAAHDLGTIQDNAVSITNSTLKTGVNQNYDSLAGTDRVNCNKTGGAASSRNTYDQVYKFRVGTSNTTQVKVSLTYPGTAWKSNIQVYTSNAGNLGTVVTGTNSAGTSTALGCDGGDNTNTRSLTFAPAANTDYFVIVSGYENNDATSRGAYKLTVEDMQLGAVACTATTAPQRAIITLTNMPADTYYVVLKIDDSSKTYAGTYDITIEDTTVGPSATVESTFVCELNNYLGYEDIYISGADPKRTKLEQTLDTGTYSLIMRTVGASGGATSLRVTMRDKAAMPDVIGCHNNYKGIDGEARTYFDYDGSPLPACEDGYSYLNDCEDAMGVPHYKDYYLVMRAVRQDDVSSGNLPFEVKIRDLDAGTPIDACTVTGSKDTYSGALTKGNYFVVVKGIAETDEGWYQLTLGDANTKLPDADATSLKSYSTVRDALTAQGIKVISVQDGTDATVRKQLEKLSSDTGANNLSNKPLVVQLSDTGVDNKTVFSLGDVGYGVTQAIQQLAQSLIMDVTLVLDASMPNPGFLFDYQAIGTPAETNCGSISADGDVWEDCRSGATPDFRVSISNPANAPVPLNDEDGDGLTGTADPTDPGGYDMLLNLVGRVQIGTNSYRNYIVEQIPVRIIPSDIGYDGPVRYYSEQGSYTKTFAADSCVTAEVPDWSRLDWTATIPDDSMIEWRACTANTSADAATCATKLVATVQPGASCLADSDCTTGFCQGESGTTPGICWNIEGPPCDTDASCGENGDCVSGACTWRALPIDLAPALRYGDNGKDHVKVETILYSSSNARSAPTIFNWRLEHDCVSGE